MKKFASSLLGLSLALGCASIASGQEKSDGNAPRPKVLQITREFVKPGKAGMAHDKAESAFVQAMTRAKWPTHYIGMTSLSGKSRALFFTFYESFAAWEKDTAAVEKNTTLSAAVDRAFQADGELLESMDQGVFSFNEEMSLRPLRDISQVRYLEISSFHVRPGRDKEWGEVVKMVKAAYEKAVPEAHWGMYEQLFGGDGGTYLVLTGRKSLAELDRAQEDSKKFQAAMGEDGMKKLNELFAGCAESSQEQLFAINPKMSYVSDEWIKSDPDFWKPKAATAPAAKPAAEDKKAKP
ncbi:MAG TPA: hypothetical protein VFN26_00940 [Candidatus Acidoferrum sp.]|nr:hypothetical protein [Candidatus Acidoferrum sp.]